MQYGCMQFILFKQGWAVRTVLVGFYSPWFLSVSHVARMSKEEQQLPSETNTLFLF